MLFLFCLFSKGDLSSPTRDGTHGPALGDDSLNHWTTREVPIFVVVFFFFQDTKTNAITGTHLWVP